MIEIDTISKIYDAVKVVDDVSFTIRKGDICAVVGASGSGKTTLLRLINRLVEPTSGCVRINGRDTRECIAYELRRQIGYVIQGNGLFPHRSVAQNIATVPQLLGWDRARIKARTDELLTLFQLDPAQYSDRLPAELSGGQQQRVGVARALAAAPDILLMDEPFGALDPIIRAKAQTDLRTIQKRFGTTIMLVTHDMNEAIALGGMIAVMDQGRLLQYAPPAQLIAAPATPYVEELIGGADRAFRMLALETVVNHIEPGDAPGEAIDCQASLRQAYGECLWSGRTALPVTKDGKHIGRISLATMAQQAARPA